MLTNKLEDTIDLAQKYKKEMENFKTKFAKINEFIYDSRFTTLNKDAEHV